MQPGLINRVGSKRHTVKQKTSAGGKWQRIFGDCELHVIKVVDVVNKLWDGERDRNIEDKMIRERDGRSKGVEGAGVSETGELQVV